VIKKRERKREREREREKKREKKRKRKKERVPVKTTMSLFCPAYIVICLSLSKK
jgi:type VI protein secretion system component VasF